MIKILTVIGARPQFIKAAALSARIAKTEGMVEVIAHTGQHYDANMSQVFFDDLGLPAPTYVMEKPKGNNLDMIAHQLVELNKIIGIEMPDYLLVYGDTDSTLAGAIAANKNNVKLVHVEAGLRSFNMDMPEENNRKITDCISDLLFTTDSIATSNLQNENSIGETEQVGDIMLETLLLVRQSLGPAPLDGSYAVATFHRPSNVDVHNNLLEILKAMAELSKERKIVIPTHPRSQQNIMRTLAELNEPDIDIQLIDPLGYVAMMELVKGSEFVFTDSGGLQKEAVYLNKPCLVLREETEWKVLEAENFLKTVPSIEFETIISIARSKFSTDFERLPDPSSVSKKICRKIKEHYGKSIHNC